MLESPQRETAGRAGFWGCGSVAGLVLLALFAYVLVKTRPRPVRHPGIRSIVGYSSYRGARSFDVNIRPAPSADGAGPMVVTVDSPNGRAASASIRFDCDVYWAEDFLSLVFNGGPGASIRHTDIQLADSEGHRFTVLPGVERRYGLVFSIPDEEAIGRIRFNDPEYHLSLKAGFDLRGPRVIDAPGLDPVVDTCTLVGDTPGYAIAMLLVLAVLWLAPPVSLVLIGRALWRWRRHRAASKT